MYVCMYVYVHIHGGLNLMSGDLFDCSSLYLLT